MLGGAHRSQVGDVTVVSVTDGNHGRALAAAAQRVGCQCVIVLHARVADGREAAIAHYGARIVRIPGNYETTTSRSMPPVHGWHVVSDTSYDGDEVIPRDVMQGYATMAAELIEQAEPMASAALSQYARVIMRGGVGGFAAGVASYLWEHYGDRRPYFIVVESEQADCLYQSARHGCAARHRCLVVVHDNAAVHAMRLLAAGSQVDIPVVAGESGAAGLAGLLALRAAVTRYGALGLDRQALTVNLLGEAKRRNCRDIPP